MRRGISYQRSKKKWREGEDLRIEKLPGTDISNDHSGMLHNSIDIWPLEKIPSRRILPSVARTWPGNDCILASHIPANMKE